jgi:mercuric ion transport protein
MSALVGKKHPHAYGVRVTRRKISVQREQGLATVGAIMGFGGVSAAAACCVLPLALASVGVGASGLAAFGPLHSPLSAIALLVVAAGWFFYAKKRRACTTDAECPRPSPATLPLLVVASALVALSAIWPFIEAPLMGLFS